MKIVIALGGNALLKPEKDSTYESYLSTVNETCRDIADLVENGHKVVIIHGNGSQIGNLLIQQERARDEVFPMPLDVCGAETQGQIGYLLQQGLRNELKKRGLDKYAITVITRVIVDKHDPAFDNPSKPVGPFYSKEEAERIMAEKPWIVIKEVSGRGYRRVVPSPEPTIIAERFAIKTLLDNGFVVIACGGGGIPITEEDGHADGIEAVIDKDLAGQKLATLIGASTFIMLTDVDGAYLNYGKPNQQMITKIDAKKLREYVEEGHFKGGSMKPKVEAAIRFVESGGKKAIIAKLDSVVEALKGKCGTWVYKK